MLREYQLTNFKAFAGPETIPIRPLTLIFGPNSSGKSSILQSLLLLKQTLEEGEDSDTLLLPKGNLVDLGSYREFVHRRDVNNKFAFKAAFEINRAPQIRQLIKSADPTLAGLRTVFAYDEKTLTMDLSSVDIFIGSESWPAITYGSRQAVGGDKIWRRFFKISAEEEIPEKFLEVSEVNSGHSFWRSWWSVMKQQMEESLREADSIVVNPGGGNHEEQFPPFEKFRQYLESYTFEEAMADFKEANQYAFLFCKNFLPVRVLRESFAEDSPFDVEISTLPDGPSWPRPDISSVTLHVCSLFRRFIRGLVYIGPLRDYPERHYIFSGNLSKHVGKSGKMVPDALFKNRELLERINKQLDRFGLGYELRVSSVTDETSELSDVFALRLVDKDTRVNVSILDVGFGISQVLPIIVQSLLSSNRTLLIEQPEIHLHPALQAELGDLFIQSALGEQQNTFLLETHSEHLILRIMRRMRDTANGTLPAGLPPVRPEDVSILYVQPKGSASVVQVLELDKEGHLLDPWPGGFFEEGFRERFA